MTGGSAGKVAVGNAQRETGESAEVVHRRQLFASVCLLALVLVSAFAVIHSTHACRGLYEKLQNLESSRWYLQEDHGRLLLEQSTWASHHRVETVAREDLNMRVPNLQQFQLVSP